MKSGIASTPKNKTPNGARFPNPCLMNIHAAYAAKGTTAHFQGWFGSIKARTPAATQSKGMPTTKYNGESHASDFDATVETITHTKIPIAAAITISQCFRFMC